MKRARITFGIVLSLGGAVWTLQGLNATFVPRSFMTGSSTWVILGLVSMAAGIGIAVSGRGK